MGVIRRNGDLFGTGTVDDMEYTLEPAISSASASEDEAEVRRSRKTPRAKPRVRDLSICEAVARRRPGAKNARRFDNLRDLISLVERDDLEMDFTIFEPSVSAFAELLSEKEKMQTWNDFVNATEEEQFEILEGRRHQQQEKSVETREDREPTTPGSVGCGSDLEDGWVPVQDRRATHPSFSAEECFQKIDKNIRTMLKRRQRPMGMLVSLEQEIVAFFIEWPNSVYKSKLSSSYERMMLHALCQYLDLVSKSFDSSGERQTQVENPHPSFSSPPVLLTHYLEHSRHL